MNPALQSDRRTFLKRFAMLPQVRLWLRLFRPFQYLPAQSWCESGKNMLMGTFVGLTVLAESRMQGEEAIGSTFEEMNRQIQIFNRFDFSTPSIRFKRRWTIARCAP